MNQSKGHWLLSDALAIIINLIMVMESEANPFDGSETFDLFFYVELYTLNKNMWQKVVKVLKPFLEFLKTFNSCQVHNMLALMLDSCFKSLGVVESFMGCGNAICFITEYDVKEVILVLIIFFYQLNPIVEAIITPCDEPTFQMEKEDNNMFGVVTSMEESSWALIIV